MSAGETRPFGLPGPLPAGERILWQGQPGWTSLALRAFHCREVAIYFAVFAAWRAATGYAEGGLEAASIRALALLPIAALSLGLLALLAWATARSSVYTITDRRVVLSIGVALTATLNLPLKAIERADLKTLGDGSGDLTLGLSPETRIAFLTLWPHARPWRLKAPEPTLRSLPDARRAAAILAEALEPGASARIAPAPVGAPAHHPSPAPRPAAVAG